MLKSRTALVTPNRLNPVPFGSDPFCPPVALGKPNKLALTAVMRKLLVHLNAQMKSHLKQQEEANRAAL